MAFLLLLWCSGVWTRKGMYLCHLSYTKLSVQIPHCHMVWKFYVIKIINMLMYYGLQRIFYILGFATTPYNLLEVKGLCERFLSCYQMKDSMSCISRHWLQKQTLFSACMSLLHGILSVTSSYNLLSDSAFTMQGFALIL